MAFRQWALYFLLALLILLGFVAPGIDWFDAAELTQAAFFLDLTHPPGEPLFVLAGRLLAYLPFADIAWRLNLLSVLCVAAVISLIPFLLPNRNGLRWTTVVALAFYPPLLLQAVRAEVYGLHYLCLFSIVFLVERFPNDRRAWFVALFLFGLGLGNHHFLTLLAIPYLLLVVYQRRPSAEALAWSLLWVFCGLGIYLFLPIRAGAPMPGLLSWGQPVTFKKLLYFVRGADYHIAYANPWGDLKPLLRAFSALGLPLVILGIFGFVRANLPGGARLRWAILLMGTLLGFAVNAFEPRNPDAYGYIAAAGLVLWIGVGHCLGQFKSPRVGIVAVLGLGALLFSQSPHPLWRWQYRLPETYIHDLYAHAPYEAIVQLPSDHGIFPAAYLQNAEGQRADLTLISGGMQDARWYRNYLERRYPELRFTKNGRPLLEDLLKQNPQRRLIVEHFETLDNGARRFAPWYHWYQYAVPLPQKLNVLGGTFFQEYAAAPQRYRITGHDIVRVTQTRLAEYYWQNQDLASAVALMEVALNRAAHVVERDRGILKQSAIPTSVHRRGDFIGDDLKQKSFLARLYLQAGLLAPAADLAHESLQKGDPEPYLFLINHAIQAGQWEQAEKWFAVTPSGMPKRNLIGGIIDLGRQDGSAAQKQLQRAVVEDPKDLGARLYWSKAMQLSGDLGGARKILEQTQEQLGPHPAITQALKQLSGEAKP